MEWVKRLHGRTVGLDTAPLIYFMEKHPDFIVFVRAFFAALNQGAYTAVTSTITLTEVLVHPLRFKQQELEQINFGTLHSAWPAKIHFAYASWAGDGASRDQSHSISKLKCCSKKI